MAIIDRVLVGEALVGEGNEAAHIDLLIGPRGSAAEDAFCQTLTNQKAGVNGVLAVLAPNLMVKPATVMFNKIAIKNESQAVQVFGAAQRGVALAVAECVEAGILPKEEVEDIYLSVGVFVHWLAEGDKLIQQNNYEATKLAIERAVKRTPSIDEVLAQKDTAYHPFSAD